MWQLLFNGLLKGHPLNRFTDGTEETLKTTPERNVRQALIDFHNKYYSSNIMTCSILGSQNLDKLESMVRKYFGDVVDKGVAVQTGADIVSSKLKGQQVPEEGLSTMTKMLPVQDEKCLWFSLGCDSP